MSTIFRSNKRAFKGEQGCNNIIYMQLALYIRTWLSSIIHTCSVHVHMFCVVLLLYSHIITVYSIASCTLQAVFIIIIYIIYIGIISYMHIILYVYTYVHVHACAYHNVYRAVIPV